MSSSPFHVSYPCWFWNSHRSPRWVNNLPQPLRSSIPNALRASSELPFGNDISAASGSAQLLPTAGMPSRGSPETVLSPASGQTITDYNYGESASHDACRMVQYPLSIMRAGSTNSSEPLEHVGNFTTDNHHLTASSRYLAVGGISKADLDSGNLVDFLEKVLHFCPSSNLAFFFSFYALYEFSSNCYLYSSSEASMISSWGRVLLLFICIFAFLCCSS